MASEPVVASAQLDSTPLISGELDVPLAWAWTADVQSPVGTDSWTTGQSVTFQLHGRSRVGAVIAASAPDLRYAIRLVGGAGKLGTVLEPTAYQGKDLASIVSDILTTAGEAVGDLSILKSVSPQFWQRAQESAGQALARIMRYAPDGVVLRVNDDGTWSAVQPTWAQVGDDLFDQRVESYPAENAASFYASETLLPDPGTSILLFNQLQKIDRVQFTWGGELSRALCWFRSGDDQMDRLFAAIRKIVESVIAESRGFSYDRWYYGNLATDADTANNTAGVFIDDTFGRIKYVPNCRLLRDTSNDVQYTKGTRLLVGWAGGDPQSPIALAEAYAGNGGVKKRVINASQEVDIIVGNATIKITADGRIVLDGGTFPIARATQDTAGGYPIVGGNPLVLG